MLNFETFVVRHGEVAAQALIENLERFHGIGNRLGFPLEERWNAVMHPAPETLAA